MLEHKDQKIIFTKHALKRCDQRFRLYMSDENKLSPEAFLFSHYKKSDHSGKEQLPFYKKDDSNSYFRHSFLITFICTREIKNGVDKIIVKTIYKNRLRK